MPSILVNAREQAPIMGERQLLPCGNKNSKKHQQIAWDIA